MMKTVIVPVPKKTIFPGTDESVTVQAVLSCPEKWAGQARAFVSYSASKGVLFRIVPADYSGKCIRLCETDGLPDAEGYEIVINGSETRIGSSSDKGICHGLATLLQIQITDRNDPYRITLPALEIYDAPDCEYRGLMVDLARFWHPYEYLTAFVDACWFYKISVLHLHFTDDQSYTLPSNIFPRLSTSGRSYSFEEIRRLCEYAKTRGVEIMPEIDVPGHNSGFTKGYPELFGVNGIICQHKDSVDAVAALFSELCDMFPYSGYIHIGGDEANLKNWLGCEKCMEYASSVGIDTGSGEEEICDRLYVNFIVRMAEAVKNKGRKPVVWEGFPKRMNGIVPKDITVMSWENYYQTTPDLLEAGFRIINCSWNPMYIVAPDVCWTPEEVSEWSIYRWRPVHPGSPFAGKTYVSEPSENVLGGQLLAWGDRVIDSYRGNENAGALKEATLIFERLPYLSQNTWNKQPDLLYNDISGSVRIAGEKFNELFEKRISEL